MENNKINYNKRVKHYNTSKKPCKSWRFFTWLAMFVSKILTHGKIEKIEKINMEGLKPPYILLSNHQSFCDFEINALATYPNDFHSIATLEGHYRRAFLMEKVGCIPKRKFTTDPHLLSACETVLNEYGDILAIYPEARYTDVGTTSHIPASYGALIKKLGKPVVAMVHRGNYLRTPFWNWRKERKVKTYSTMKKILDSSDIERLSADEITEIIRRELWHDEYKYQKDNNIIINGPYRAEGLHKVLYQCPHCMTEHKMASMGTKLWCKHCNKEWEMTELGELRALNGETEFSHIPDWYNWERENVKALVREGGYSFEDVVDVYSLPHTRKFFQLGKAVLKHSAEHGLTLEGSYRDKEYKISRPSAGLYSIHTEHDYCYVRSDSCLQISTHDDTFVCYPTKSNVVTKIYFAIEAIHDSIEAEKQKKHKLRMLKRAQN